MESSELKEGEGEPQGDAPSKAEGAANGGKEGGKIRSETAYPFYGLTKALEIVDAVRAAGGNEAAPQADVMRVLKVQKVTERVWAYGVPAAIQFGLIERIGRGEEGKIKLTELAMRIKLPGTPEEGRLAMVAAFRTPDLYAKLLDRFAGHPVPTPEGLKNILQRDPYKIVESMAPTAASAFLDSLKVAELITPSNTVSMTPDAAASPGSGSAVAAPAAPAASPPAPKANEGMQTIQVPADFIVHPFQLRRDLRVAIPLPPELTAKDVDRLHKFLGTLTFDEDL